MARRGESDKERMPFSIASAPGVNLASGEVRIHKSSPKGPTGAKPTEWTHPASHLGLRRSRKALMPSFRSSVPARMVKLRRSITRPALSEVSKD